MKTDIPFKIDGSTVIVGMLALFFLAAGIVMLASSSAFGTGILGVVFILVGVIMFAMNLADIYTHYVEVLVDDFSKVVHYDRVDIIHRDKVYVFFTWANCKYVQAAERISYRIYYNVYGRASRTGLYIQGELHRWSDIKEDLSNADD